MNTLSKNIIRNCATHNAQRGGALLVAMIMIFMLSIMGVSSMRSSTLERKMASNSIQTATAFQGAESASEMVLNDDGYLTQAINIANAQAIADGLLDQSQSIPIDVDLLQDIGLESEAVLQFVGNGPAYGYSAGVGGNNFVAYRFEVEASATLEAVRARAFVTQGAYRVAPGR